MKATDQIQPRPKRIVFLGTYDVTKPRVRILIEAARRKGFEVLECHEEVWKGVEDKSQLRRLSQQLYFLFRWFVSYPKLIVRYLFVPKHDLVIIGYLGQLDVLVLWPFIWLRGVPLYWDAFLSLYDTAVRDRKLFSRFSPVAMFLYLGEWICCRLADVVFVDTKAHGRYFEELFSLPEVSVQRVFVGAEDLFFAPPPSESLHDQKQGAFLVLFYGQFIPLHGIDTIIEAATRISERDKNIQFVVIGTGQEEERISRILTQRKLENITRIQWAPYHTLHAWLHKADLVLGIFGTSQKAQTVIPNKIFQALAAGKPIVTADTPAVRELLEETRAVRLVPPGNGEALAEAIFKMANEPQSVSTSRDCAVSIAKVGDQLEELLTTKEHLSKKRLDPSQEVSDGSAHLLIVNQHGENRGDEAAMRAMLGSFAEHLKNVKFTILAQFRDRNLSLTLNEEVQILPMVISVSEAFGLVLYSLLSYMNLKPRFLLSKVTRKIIAAYESATMVVSAPGGPYFGDLYWGHEIVHWFFIWLGWRYKKPLFLYAPSAGPFRIWPLNIVRRSLFRKFDTICLREEISAKYLRELCGESLPIFVTADSALQRELKPLKRSEYFHGEREKHKDKFLVAVSILNYSYPQVSDVEQKRREFNQTLIAALSHLSKQRDTHFLFLPQLYGRVHSDLPYLTYFCSLLPRELSWEIVNREFDSTMQQRIVGMSDLCIASRYHPQIFAASAGVPGICIYYEHKALGFMKALKKEEFAFDIYTLNSKQLIDALNMILPNRDLLSQEIKNQIPQIRKRSQQTTLLALQVLRGEKIDSNECVSLRQEATG